MSGIGEKFSGFARGVSGAGDMLRGTFNDASDRAGDAITGRNDAGANQAHQGTTANGAEDFNEGIRRFRGEGSTHQTANERKAAEETAREQRTGNSEFSRANSNMVQNVNNGIDAIGERIAGRK